LTPVPQLSDWVAESCTRWATLVDPLPEDDPQRFPLGQLMIAYQLRGPLRTVSAAELLHVLQSKTPRHTGWPPFWVPTRPDIAPYSSGWCNRMLARSRW
jgi:hypothetical protein